MFLLLPGFSLLEVSSALAVFEAANATPEIAARSGRYSVRLLASQEGPVVSSSGVPVSAEALPARFSGPQTLVIAGGTAASLSALAAAPARHLRQWLARQHRQVHRGAALGSAALQLLSDAAATSQRRHQAKAVAAAAVSRAHARRVDPSPHSAWVSIAMDGAIDLALSWVEQDHGRVCAEAVAARMPGPRSRAYGPSGFRSGLIEQASDDERIDALHLWITKHLRERLPVHRLAAQALMSLRSFARFYKQATGVTPARGVEQIRLDAACRLIETSVRPLKAIAAQCGYGSQEVMRRAFVRNLKMAPLEYRRRYGAAGAQR
ncbi:GlxA family transcriptional regulator [Variovorax paradoxus]|uniref:GlxA family transcriptional regulator n=1 Tax=Variovorax paradoxus TaxID=34073 RepID=UPI003D65F0C0